MKKSLACIVVLACITVLGCTSEERDPRPNALISSKHAMINGTKDTSASHNAVVGLYRKKNSNSSCATDGHLFCTGTLIHPKWVLTAAHCVTDINEKTGAVSAGACNSYTRVGVGNTESAVGKHLYDVKKIYYHSNYEYVFLAAPYENYYTMEGDIALIELDSEIPSSVAKPILPHPKWLPVARNDLNKPMEFAGFGITETGNMGTKLKFTTDATDYCGNFNSGDHELGCLKGEMKLNGCHPNEYYATQLGSCYHNENEYIFLPHGSFYYTQEKGGPCQGDSGGPGFFTLGGVEYVSGVTSYGDKICAGFGVSTAVEDYYDWIVAKAPAVASQYVEICGNDLDDDGNGKKDCDDSACAGDKSCANLVEICGNGADDDYNGKADCEDPACASELSCQPENCSNGVDDNLNGKTDCEDTQCYEDAWCQVEHCDNKIDDNRDGLMDCDDPTCMFDSACSSDPPPITLSEKCDNGMDDNGDGLADCDDPECAQDPACTSQPVPVNDENCANGQDDNGDGLADCDDPQCAQDAACTSQPIEDDSENCTNGVDDNHDGLTDCDDPLCMLDQSCTSGGDTPADTENCSNDVDDNGDGLIDCNDPLCASESICQSQPGGSTGTDVSTGKEICDNGKDDNNDGLADCDDPACIATCFSDGIDAATQLAGSCATAPRGSSSAPIGFGLAFLGLLGLCVKRRKQ